MSVRDAFIHVEQPVLVLCWHSRFTVALQKEHPSAHYDRHLKTTLTLQNDKMNYRINLILISKRFADVEFFVNVQKLAKPARSPLKVLHKFIRDPIGIDEKYLVWQAKRVVSTCCGQSKK